MTHQSQRHVVSLASLRVVHVVSGQGAVLDGALQSGVQFAGIEPRHRED